MSTVKIDRGVPLPKRQGRPPKYPFATMLAGESFWAPVTTATLQACARRAAVPGAVFTAKAEPRGTQPGARCWRAS
jgi:hypothetical protein